MKESQFSGNNEIGKTEKENFRRRVHELIQSPKILNGSYALGLEDKDIDLPPSWTAIYKKDETAVFLMTPEPGHALIQGEGVSASIKTPLLITDNGIRVFRTVTLDLDVSNDEISYEEEELIFDANGKIVPKQPVSCSLQDVFNRAAQMGALGERVVTPQRYKDCMDVLDSLTPEDESND